MAVDGTTTAEYVSKEAVSGSNVVLTIDSKLQNITEQALKNNVEKIGSTTEYLWLYTIFYTKFQNPAICVKIIKNNLTKCSKLD